MLNCVTAPGRAIAARGPKRPFGNGLDPTLNLDILEVAFRNLARWKAIETPQRLRTVRRVIGLQRRLTQSGALTRPRSHIYYSPPALHCIVNHLGEGGRRGGR